MMLYIGLATGLEMLNGEHRFVSENSPPFLCTTLSGLFHCIVRSVDYTH